jgi:hypothetical protein
MSSEAYGESPPKYGRIARFHNNEDGSPFVTHGKGTLTALIQSRSSSSLQNLHRRPSSFRGRDTSDEEEVHVLVRSDGGKSRRDEDINNEDFRRDERRLSAVLMGPQMRSQRLIGNSNPRYRWERYWKSEEELKDMRKPM